MSSSNKPVSLKISEIFFSLQGEATRAGLPTVFVRLTGCPLRCVWCDSEHSFTGGKRMSQSQVIEAVAHYGARQVCVTGGEPLAQKACLPLLSALCDAGYDVSLETSGALDIGGVDPRVSRIVDLKAPGSGESAKNRWQNLALLTPRDELKFVLIVSRVGVVPGPETRIRVSASGEQKCERCWHYHPTVGENAEAPTLCARCYDNIFGQGESRSYA